jgi:two-component system cell cycle sensor histidine kinase/response regulator CckA
MLTIQTTVVSGSELSKRFRRASADRYACIAVADTGAGIDEETRQKIFEPFFTTKEVGKGTGLGLAVVYAIMQSHQGYVDVASEPGRGTTFKLYFPILSGFSITLQKELLKQDEIPGGTETILLVEDEEELLMVMKIAIQRKGYQVLTARDGIEAVNVFTHYEQQIDLVLSDVGLPKLDGVSLFRSLREFEPKIRFILASGYLDPLLKSDLLSAGARAFIQKPYDPREVMKKIREALDAPE